MGEGLDVMAGGQVGSSKASSRAQIVTCTSGQEQTTMTMGGSDIMHHGLAGSDDGVIIVMASRC